MRTILITSAPCSSKSAANAAKNAWLSLLRAPFARPPVLGRPFSNRVIFLFCSSMAGGETDPLGARAMYLGNTVYRIHGTNAPETIGSYVSSGCIRLTNEDVEDT